MFSLHTCVELSLDPSGRLIVIDFLSGCTIFTGVPGWKKCTVAPASPISSLLVNFMIDVEYAVSIFLIFWLLMIVVLSP